jgi:hypothetical protein
MVWMSQNQLAEFFSTSRQNIGQNIINILEDNELDSKCSCKELLYNCSGWQTI